MNLFNWIMEVIGIIVALVSIVERPGDGEQKRAEVIDLFLDKGKEHLSMPEWAKSLFLRRSFIGWLIDVVVWAANTYGPFGSTDSAGDSGAPQSAS